ncbi:kinase-like protein [Aspergillus ibericus CBS 121593]|uniref:Kinase-like protein n=1 Tax=Aspergillus ibericus CBS 121593 TaxID=1448316 RepID=A0A395HCZ5_9EURO|nr:kinase-like protein [Aspergillus ibericus CBS 121593]RAL05526.1 kinase-like protein [Aspergillus ibericus CBS 121593]
MTSTLAELRQVPLTQGASVKGDSGQTYRIEELLTEARQTGLHVYRASAEGKQYVIKNMVPGELDYQLDLQRQLASSPNIRTAIDSARESEAFIYPFLDTNLLQFAQKRLSIATRKQILRRALQGLVDMHAIDMQHNGKFGRTYPNNILIDYTEPAAEGQEFAINQVRIADLEDTVVVPPGSWLEGPLCGNAMWRSPESWARSFQNQTSDVFSFGLVIVYVMTKRIVLRVPDDQLNADDSWRHILRLHLSYFADIDGIERFLEHLGDENPPREPVEKWMWLEPELRDLVAKMTYINPMKRITAKEALEHPWFARVE